MRTALLPPRMELVAVGDPARPACATLLATTLPRMEEPLSEAELMRLLEVTASCTTVGLVVTEGDTAWLSPDLAWISTVAELAREAWASVVDGFAREAWVRPVDEFTSEAWVSEVAGFAREAWVSTVVGLVRDAWVSTIAGLVREAVVKGKSWYWELCMLASTVSWPASFWPCPTFTSAPSVFSNCFCVALFFSCSPLSGTAFSPVLLCTVRLLGAAAAAEWTVVLISSAVCDIAAVVAVRAIELVNSWWMCGELVEPVMCTTGEFPPSPPAISRGVMVMGMVRGVPGDPPVRTKICCCWASLSLSLLSPLLMAEAKRVAGPELLLPASPWSFSLLKASSLVRGKEVPIRDLAPPNTIGSPSLGRLMPKPCKSPYSSGALETAEMVAVLAGWKLAGDRAARIPSCPTPRAILFRAPAPIPPRAWRFLGAARLRSGDSKV